MLTALSNKGVSSTHNQEYELKYDNSDYLDFGDEMVFDCEKVTTSKSSYPLFAVVLYSPSFLGV